MKLTQQAETELLHDYYKLWTANLSGDVETFASYMVDDFSIFGSANGEIFFTKDGAIEFYAATAHELKDKAQLRDRNISIQALDENNVVMRETSNLYVLIGDVWTFYGFVRISCVLKQIDKRWKVVHQHASFPDHRTEEGQQLAAEAIEKENLQLREAVKRRTIELEHKNRELEIEASLERIRAAAMSMNKTEDVLSICKVMFTEMGALGFKDVRNALINFWDDLHQEMLDYDYADFSGGNSCRIPYNSHPAFEKFQQQIRSATDSFVELMITGDELKTWKERRKKIGEYDDPRLENITTLYYYFYSIGVGAIGLSTFSPLVEESLQVLKRFRNVFDLAYRRYIDIQKAEAQTRESQIQLALERVRARAMAMHKSEELSDLSLELVKQVQALGVATWFCAFNIYDDPQGSVEWGSNGQGTFPKYRTPREGIFLRYYEAGQTGETFLVNEIGVNECPAHYENLCSLPGVGDQLLQMKAAGLPFPTYQIDHVAYFKYGYLLFITYEPVPEAHEVFIRFSNVFEQSYTRFLDLQKAEAQAREAQIELSMERIRAQVTSMQSSPELLDIVVMMRKEFVTLGYEAHYFWYMRWLPNIYEKAMTSGDGTRIGMVMTLPRHIHGDIKLLADWEKSSEPFVVYAMDVDAAVSYVDKMVSLGNFELVDPNAPTLDDIRHIGGLTFVMARTTHGEIGFSLPGEVPNPSQEAQTTLVRFAGVFDLAYKRFLDLQLKEEQSAKLKEEKERLEFTLSELKATQKQLIQSEKMASLGELTAGIAHEIQNPLNFVNNFSEVSNELLNEMMEEVAKGNYEEVKAIADDVKQNLEKINHHGKRADDIVKGMLQHSRSSSATKEPTDINKLADEYLRLAYHGLRAKDKSFNAKLKTDYDVNIGNIEIIPQDIGRVILNLITNAFYAVGEKKKQNAVGYEPTVSISTSENDRILEIKVADNGNGIPQKILDKIFQPFFTTKPTGQGTGLGLSLSYDIIKAHGGDIKVQSEPKGGSTFIIQLPLTN